MAGKYHLIRSKQGVTLVELIVAFGISVLLFASVFTMNLLARQTYEFNTTYLDIHGGARTGMDWMTKDIRWANQILSSIIIDTVTYTTADDVVVLEIPSIDINGDVITGINDYIVYRLNDEDPTVLERIIDADDTSSRIDAIRTITRNVNTLGFTDSGGTGLSGVEDVTSLTRIEIALTTQKVSSDNGVASGSLNSVVELRND